MIKMSRLLLSFLLAVSFLLNIGWYCLDYLKGDPEIKEQLMIDVTYDLLERGYVAEDIESIEVKHTSPFQSNRLEAYGYRYNWEVQVKFKSTPDEMFYYFYSDDAYDKETGDQLDGISLSNEK